MITEFIKSFILALILSIGIGWLLIGMSILSKYVFELITLKTLPFEIFFGSVIAGIIILLLTEKK